MYEVIYSTLTGEYSIRATCHCPKCSAPETGIIIIRETDDLAFAEFIISDLTINPPPMVKVEAHSFTGYKVVNPGIAPIAEPWRN